MKCHICPDRLGMLILHDITVVGYHVCCALLKNKIYPNQGVFHSSEYVYSYVFV